MEDLRYTTGFAFTVQDLTEAVKTFGSGTAPSGGEGLFQLPPLSYESVLVLPCMQWYSP